MKLAKEGFQPPINADKRRSHLFVFIGVHRRLSAASLPLCLSS
jgi:hypothetical protein